jgi:hypothetical protein
VEIPDETYSRYYEDIHLEVDWDRATQIIRTGELSANFFTLPWWQAESRALFLYGTEYNKKRLAELRRLPWMTAPDRKRWRAAVLYPGVADEWTPVAVGVMTQAGHIGCIAGDVCNAGLGKLIRELEVTGERFAVPLRLSGSDAAVMVPDGKDLSAFDYPWVGEDPERYKKAARLNRSHVIGLLMLKHGLTDRWRSLAARIACYGEDSGVSVRQPVPLLAGSRVMVSLREEEAEAAIEKASELVGFEIVPRPRGLIDKRRANEIGRIDALITRYPESSVPVCEYARENNIPIFRPDEFIGGLAEAALRQQDIF